MVLHNKELSYKKILIIRLGAIGDVVNSMVIHQAIKEKHPDVEIHYMTLDYIAPLLKNDKNISKIWTIENSKKKDMFYILKKGFELRKERFDAVISLSNSIRNVIMNIIAAPKIIARRSKKSVNGHAVGAFFNSAAVLFDDLKLPQRVVLEVDNDAKEKISNIIKEYPRPYIVINPGGAHNSEREGRIWREDYWIETGNRLVEKYGGTVLVVGAKSEREVHKPFLKIKNSVLFSGELSLIESAALYSFSDLFLSIDSGPLHIAAALGVKALSIMGSTAGRACGPYSPNGAFISPLLKCAPCKKTKCPKLVEGEIYTPCISTITPDMVMNKISELKFLDNKESNSSALHGV